MPVVQRPSTQNDAIEQLMQVTVVVLDSDGSDGADVKHQGKRRRACRSGAVAGGSVAAVLTSAPRPSACQHEPPRSHQLHMAVAASAVAAGQGEGGGGRRRGGVTATTTPPCQWHQLVVTRELLQVPGCAAMRLDLLPVLPRAAMPYYALTKHSANAVLAEAAGMTPFPLQLSPPLTLLLTHRRLSCRSERMRCGRERRRRARVPGMRLLR
jgi:hypothetical protein